MSEKTEGESCSDSEADPVSYKSKRESCLRDLLHLETQFADLRQKLYQERVSQVEKRVEELRNGRGWEYQRKVAELEAEARQRSAVADTLRQFQLEEARLRLEAAKAATLSSFENRRCIRLDEIKENIEGKIQKLKAQKRESDMSLALWLSEKASTLSPRAEGENSPPKRRRTNSRRKVTAVEGRPYVVHMLREEEIQADWTLIRQAVMEAELMEQQRNSVSPSATPYAPPPPPSLNLPPPILSS